MVTSHRLASLLPNAKKAAHEGNGETRSFMGG